MHYRWHPLFGRTLRLVRRAGGRGGDCLHCEVSDGTVASIPFWMLDPSVCAGHSFGNPGVSVSALADLRQLINALDEPQGETRSKALPPEVEHGQSDNESSASALGDGSGSSANSQSHE